MAPSKKSAPKSIEKRDQTPAPKTTTELTPKPQRRSRRQAAKDSASLGDTVALIPALIGGPSAVEKSKLQRKRKAGKDDKLKEPHQPKTLKIDDEAMQPGPSTAKTQNTLSFNPAAVRKRKSRLINPAAEAKNKEKQAEAEKHMPRNFKDLSGLLQLSGHRSQDHFEGNACFTMALTSLCQSVPAINWTKNTINSILEDGHATYRDVINAANASGCGYSAVQLLRNEDLNFVGQCVAAEGRRNFIEFEHNFYGMVSGKYEEGDFYQSLKVNLRKALDVSDKVLFLCRGKWISIQKSGDWLAVFNSHSLNGHGLIETGKTAKVIITKDIGACYKLMLAGTSSVDEMAVDENLDFVEYELLAVKATEVV